MIERGNGGSIVMMSSMLARRSMEIRSVYCCTKAALDQLTQCLALELGPHKVRYYIGLDSLVSYIFGYTVRNLAFKTMYSVVVVFFCFFVFYFCRYLTNHL